MTDIWNERAQAYRESGTHASGDDLDLVVAWCEPAPGVNVLDVATGGGHVARRLREAGAKVVTVDAAPGMEPDVVAPADHLPFADSSFDVVACRIAVHHFPDALAAVKEMARVASDRVVICDNTFTSEAAEEADRLRDPSHVRNYAVAEWHSFFELAGLEIADEAVMVRDTDFEDWLDRTETPEDVRPRVRELLDSRIRDGRLELPTVVLKGVKTLMAIILDNDTRLVVAGLTGSEGRFHGLRNRAYGTNLVAGVTPGKGGQDVEGVPSSTRSPRPSKRPVRMRRSSSSRPASRSTRSTRPSTRASRP